MTELLSVLRNRNVLLLLLGRLISAGGDYFYFVALSVAIFRYSHGNALFISLFWLARLVPNLVLGPLGGYLADRLGYRRAMILADLVRMVVVAALAVFLSSSTWLIIFPVALVVAGFGRLYRPASVGLVPALLRSKEERLAANATSIEVNAIALIVGSALGGVLTGRGVIAPLLLFDAATFGVSVATLLLIRSRPAEAEAPAAPVSAEPTKKAGQAFIASLQLLVRRPLLVFAALTMILPELASGALSVWMVPYSIQTLHLGNAGVGYLYSGLGMGMALGGVVAAVLGSNLRLDQLLAVSIVVGGLAMAMFGIFPVAVAALALIALVGVAETVEFATYQTLVQQSVPANMIGRTSGMIDSFFFNMMLVGNVVSGVLAQTVGVRPSMIGLGALTVSGVAFAWWALETRTGRLPDLRMLESIPAFAHVPLDVREWALRRMVREEFPADTVIVRQGDIGENFYTIASGRVEVDVAADGHEFVRELGPGDYFGEIALLRDVPRTATVRTLEPVSTYVLSREDFLELQQRAAEFKESLLEAASARLAEDSNFKLTLATRSE